MLTASVRPMMRQVRRTIDSIDRMIAIVATELRRQQLEEDE